MSGPEAERRSRCAREGSLVAGKYRLAHVLGEGGMGVVYAAEHVDLQKRVAIKVMRDELTSQVELVERMITEARTVARLRSEHVAQVIDVGKLSSGAPFIVMEYLDGRDLATELQHGEPLPIALAVAYVLQACEAVAEAHAAGIIHRDLKPENLFLSARTDGEPTVKVLDFGISRNVRGPEIEPADSLIAGSPDYMSPEAMRAETRAAPTTDIWSLGAVLYELLTGRRAFEGANVTETCSRVLVSEPIAPSALVPTIPAGLEAVVLRCLRKQPSARFDSVVAFAKALAEFGPEGSVEQAERVLRVASGGRWNPRLPVKRPSLASFTDLPNSTAAVVAESPRPTGDVRRETSSRWRSTLVLCAAAVAAVSSIAMVRSRSESPARVAVTAVAAPPQAAATASPPIVSAAAAAATQSSKTAPVTKSASARPVASWRGPLPVRPPITSASVDPAAAPVTSSAFSYDDAPPPAPSAQAPAQASVDAWSLESFGGRK
jgi:eukaryotic-like serine/threonine-protein kinase